MGCHRSRRGWLAGLALAVLVATGCRSDFDVVVTVAEDGSGTVEAVTTLDEEASEAIRDLDLDEDGLPLTDLIQSGWDVDRPEQAADGSTVVMATKEFGTPSQLGEVMDELTGSDGVFRNFRLGRVKTFARVDYELTGTIDTSEGLEAFTDPELDRALGMTLTELASRYEAEAGDANLSVEVALPGEVQGEPPANAVDSAAEETRARWTASLGDADVEAIELRSSTRNVTALVLRGGAVVLGVLAALVAFAQLMRILLPDRRRRPRRKPKPQAAPEAAADAAIPAEGGADGDGEDSGGEQADGEAAPATGADDDGEEEPYEVVALGGMGVLFREGGGSHSALIGFARDRASTVTDDEIVARARALELGRITSGEFWSATGVDGDPGQLDADYLAQLNLTPGLIRYLRSLRDRGVRVACVANFANDWATTLKSGHSLEGLIDPWVISGAVGVRKPDTPIFEVLRRVSETEPAKILIVDDSLDNLDAARDLGFGTAWFTPDGERADARDHTVIRSFDAPDEGSGEG